MSTDAGVTPDPLDRPAVARAAAAPAARSSSAPRFRPVDPHTVPALAALIERLGRGRLLADELDAPFGRNDIWSGPTTTGHEVFVKHLVGAPADVAARMRRLLTYQQVLDQAPPGQLRGPALLGVDHDHALVAFERLTGARTGSAVMVDEEFTEADAAAVGAAVAELHELDPPAQADTSRPALPSLDLLDAVPLGVYENLSFAEIEAWRLQQQDPALIAALHRLAAAEDAAPKVPAHCDLRVDQLLLVDGRWWVTDGEEFRLSDAARDIGSFAGEWIYRGVLDIVTTRGDLATVSASMDHQEVLGRGAERLLALRPLVDTFWRTYLRGRSRIDPQLPARAAAFAGWHLLDRLIAGSSAQASLSAIERAAAGIGRSLLLQPLRFGPAVGLDPAAVPSTPRVTAGPVTDPTTRLRPTAVPSRGAA